MSECTLFFKLNGKIKIPKDFKLGPFRWVKCMLKHKMLFGTLYLNKNTSKFIKQNKQNKQKKQLLKRLKNKNIWYFTTGDKVISYHFFYKSNIAEIIKYIISYTDVSYVPEDKFFALNLNKIYYNWYLLYNSKFSAAINHSFFYQEYIHQFRIFIENKFNIQFESFYTFENLYIFLKKHTTIIDDYYNKFIPSAKKYCKIANNIYDNDSILKNNLKKIKSAKTFKSIIMGKYVIKNASTLNMNMFI